MKEAKGILALFLVLVVLAASACTGSPDSTTTPSGTPSETQTIGETQTAGPSTSTSSTTTPREELYWSNPWEYSTVKVEGGEYRVTYYRVDYRIRPNQSAPLYEYIIEKTLEKTTVPVYGVDLNGDKVDLGEREVYQYTTVVVPLKAAQLRDRLIIKVWYLTERDDAFLYPWHIGWLAPMGEGFVGFRFEYGNRSFTMTSPAQFQSGLMPYFEGDGELINDVNEDLANLYMGWLAITQLGLWSALSDLDLSVPRSGAWSDGFHQWTWATEPDGSATFSGVKFRLVDARWEFTSADGVRLEGKAKIAPNLFLPVETEGYFSYTGEEPVLVYGHMKVEDLKLEKVS